MKKIVILGGGTGTYTALKGLKDYTSELTAVVSMSDSGGSSGILRDEFGILPPGDVTRCLIALSNDSGRLRELFDYRFNGKDEKHKLGNLILTALEKITGNPAEAIKEASKILNISGQVLPVTIDNSHLYAQLEDDEIIRGETNIDIPKHDPSLKIKKVWLQPQAYIYRETASAIERADLIVLGPGDLYTSVIPNLLVKGVPETLKKTKAKKCYVCNIMTKHGETTHFNSSNFVDEIEKYLGFNLDLVICNNKKPEKSQIEKYSLENSFFVEPMTINRKCPLILEDLLSNQKDQKLLRHDPHKLARAIMSVE